MGWVCTAIWEPTGTGILHCTEAWGADDAEALLAVTAGAAMDLDAGLPGRVWGREAPIWLASDDLPALPRAAAFSAAGVTAAVGVPLRSERGLVGVLEGFLRGAGERDDSVIASMEVVGVLLGQLTERHRGDRERRAIVERHRATLEATLDPIVAMDHEGRVVEFNPAAERTFGYARAAVLGREMADILVPEELREAHRAGLARYLSSGEARVLDRRIEIDAVDASGRRFPVELTITRLQLEGDPIFTGQLRDITERRAQEEELRASRTRIVAAADAARRRIERDLHDGAQQQLVGLAVNLRSAQQLLERGELSVVSEVLGEAVDDLQQALAELRELARGIHPAVLSDGGLGPALRGLARRCPLPVEIAADPDGRLPAQAEATLYFVAAEALTNAARYSDASLVTIRVATDGQLACVEIADEGRGGADPSGQGLRGLADRVEAAGGTLTITSSPGAGTTIRAEVPCAL